MKKRVLPSIPNTITSLNLLSGCVAVYMAFNLGMQFGPLTGQQWFYVFVGAAALFDFCDGLSARAFHAYSAMGKELDSLSDLVSFGVAPGMLMLNIMLRDGTIAPLAFITFIIPLCGAMRLAKFNVDETQTTTFSGLPIPANALFWIGMAAWIDRYAYPGDIAMSVIVVLMSLAMVWHLRMFSLKFKSLSFYDNVKRYGIIFAAIAFVVMYGMSGFAWTILLYILISFFTRKHPE